MSDSNSENFSHTQHVPILVEPIVSALVAPFLKLPREGDSFWVVDCTLGGGGHTAALLEALAQKPALKKHRILALDQDPKAVEAARRRFQNEVEAGRLEIQNERFSQLGSVLKDRPVLGLLADLGFSSDQMSQEDRGFSFHSAGPLDMRLDPSRGRTCQDLLNTLSEEELEVLLREGGEERFSKQIARAVISQRRAGTLPSTPRELSLLVVKAIPSFARHGKIHAATRAFQAFRIAVNEELSELDSLLREGVEAVLPGGRIAILSFHSLEDRRVKHKFRDEELFLSVFKKPLQAGEEEVRRNPRSRSAKLRIVERK